MPSPSDRLIDLNADVGEGPGEGPLYALISSANVACGGHAGDVASMREAIRLAQRHGVAVGAHPSYPDRAGFGRVTKNLEPRALSDAISAQIEALLRWPPPFLPASPTSSLMERCITMPPPGPTSRWPWPSASLRFLRSCCSSVSRAHRRFAFGASAGSASPARASPTGPTPPTGPSFPARWPALSSPIRPKRRRRRSVSRGGAPAPRSACTPTRREPWRSRPGCAADWKAAGFVVSALARQGRGT